jgi:glycosyltransferase involved in cell wall biosynthesis
MISQEAVQEQFRKQNTCVIVPTYNNTATLEKVIREILNYSGNLIVVNDGSTQDTSGILKKFPFIEVVSYTPNRGKGIALRTGFKKAMELGYDYAITLDSDGQHFPEDLPLLLEASKKNPGDLIIGSRNMEQQEIPSKSSFGNKFSNFWFWVETGIKLPDTQSGYRLYPVNRLRNINFITSKFEFEIEVLVRASWNGIKILPVPVKIFYEDKEKRISHFRPIIDFARISVLNTVLVILALLYIKPRNFLRKLRTDTWFTLRNLLASPHETERTKAISIGFGIFMGIAPIWGFQMLVALALAIVMRLNKALVIVAANISIPPMIPIILYLSYITGKIWMGEQADQLAFSKELTLDSIQSNFIQYVLGSFTLATICGLFFGFVTYFTLKVFGKKKRVVSNANS